MREILTGQPPGAHDAPAHPPDKDLEDQPGYDIGSDAQQVERPDQRKIGSWFNHGALLGDQRNLKGTRQWPQTLFSVCSAATAYLSCLSWRSSRPGRAGGATFGRLAAALGQTATSAKSKVRSTV